MSETREDVLREFGACVKHMDGFAITGYADPQSMADEILRLKSLLRGTLCAIEDTEADRADEILRLRALIDATAVPWLALDPGIAWEGAIDAAMAAACAEITRLRDEARGVRAVEAWRQTPKGHVHGGNGTDFSAETWTPDRKWHTVATAPTYAALGLALLKQGKVTL